MKVKEFVGSEPIHAYIIPSGDSHQVIYNLNNNLWYTW